MTIDYITASLPALAFDEPPPLDWDAFLAQCAEHAPRVIEALERGRWRDVDTQIRNAIAQARDGEDDRRPAEGCDVALAARIAECFRETNPLEREKLLDKVRWDAAGALADPSSPLGFGALVAYAARLQIAIRRSCISAKDGDEAFSSLVSTAKETK